MKTQDINQQIKQKTRQIIGEIVSFKECETSFRKNIIQLCDELINLHRIKDPDYNFCNLIQERDLENYSDILETYVPYDISPMVTKLYTEGKLSNTDLMVLANADKEFKQPEQQRKIVTGILSKEIKSRDLIRASKNEIREMIGEETDEMDDDTKKILDTVYQMEHIAKRINEFGKNIKKNKYYNEKKVIDGFNHLKNAIQFGLKIKLE